MKKYILTANLLFSGLGVVSIAVNSCTAVASSSLGVAIIKRVLLGGIDKGLATFRDKDAFLQNNLIDQAMPSQLRDINNLLAKVAPSLVQKEREYIAQAAAYTVNVSEPILVNAVNSLTSEDVARIAQGGSGMATQVLKEKSATQLAAAITPKVDEQLNKFGIVNSINTALKGSSFLGNLLGNNNTSNTTGISQLASEQLVNGLFKIVEKHEKDNYQQIYNILGTK